MSYVVIVCAEFVPLNYRSQQKVVKSFYWLVFLVALVLEKLFQDMWDGDPLKRPSAGQVVKRLEIMLEDLP